MGKKEDKRRIKGLSNEAITMQQFLNKVLGVQDENLLRAQLTHSDLRTLFPDLKRTSFDHILDDPRMVYSGDIVLVIDNSHKLIPYLVSEQKKNLEDLGINDVMSNEDWTLEPTEEWVKPKTEAPAISDYDLTSMSTYELEQLMRVYSATKQVGNFQKVRRELVSRSDSKRSNKISKAKAKRKEYKKDKFEY